MLLSYSGRVTAGIHSPPDIISKRTLGSKAFFLSLERGILFFLSRHPTFEAFNVNISFYLYCIIDEYFKTTYEAGAAAIPPPGDWFYVEQHYN